MSKDAKYFLSRFATYALFTAVRAALMTGLFLWGAFIESRYFGNQVAGKTMPIILYGGLVLVVASLIASHVYASDDLRGWRDARLRRRLEPDYLTRYLAAQERNDPGVLKDYEDDPELSKRLTLRVVYR